MIKEGTNSTKYLVVLVFVKKKSVTEQLNSLQEYLSM